MQGTLQSTWRISQRCCVPCQVCKQDLATAADAACCRILDVPSAQAGPVDAVQPGISLPAVATGLIGIAAVLLLVAARQ